MQTIIVRFVGDANTTDGSARSHNRLSSHTTRLGQFKAWWWCHWATTLKISA
jgi:hypothetical protein